MTKIKITRPIKIGDRLLNVGTHFINETPEKIKKSFFTKNLIKEGTLCILHEEERKEKHEEKK